MLKYFQQNGMENVANAFDLIPRNLRTMYPHAYQSYIWNKALSLRLTLGAGPIVGDLVRLIETREPVVYSIEPNRFRSRFRFLL